MSYGYTPLYAQVTDPNAPEPIPITNEPTRFDKSVHGILNGRNAAMFVNIEAKKRNWDIEFEEVEAEGPVHDRTYSYTLAVGPDLVTAGKSIVAWRRGRICDMERL